MSTAIRVSATSRPPRSSHPVPSLRVLDGGLAGSTRGRDVADERLVAAYRAGDQSAGRQVLARYRGLVRSQARAHYLAGADPEDVRQEALIGLYKALRDFDDRIAPSFAAFAALCMRRQVVSAIRAANRHKHAALNSYVSLTGPPSGSGEEAARAPVPDAMLAAPALTDPAEAVIAAERYDELCRLLQGALTDFERAVLTLHMEGRSHAEIAGLVNRGSKAVDNALQRIKGKVGAHLRACAIADATDSSGG